MLLPFAIVPSGIIVFVHVGTHKPILVTLGQYLLLVGCGNLIINLMYSKDFRVLTAVEMGMKNHDLVPVELITSISKLGTGRVPKIISTLHAFKLVAHDRSVYDGYRLTFQVKSGIYFNALPVVALVNFIASAAVIN